VVYRLLTHRRADDQCAVDGHPEPFPSGGDGDPLPTTSVQFGSWAFTQRAKESGLVPSTGSIGDCYDNGLMESFWSRMQIELLDRHRWKTRIELANAIFDYLEIWHNRRRRHSALGWISPVEYEMKHSTVA
jgi:transposase InsO family protein